jgi:hypothetical protein
VNRFIRYSIPTKELNLSRRIFMNDANMMQMVVGTICAAVTGVSVAFVVYWNVIAKKHVNAPIEKSEGNLYTGKPALHLATAQFRQN